MNRYSFTDSSGTMLEFTVSAESADAALQIAREQHPEQLLYVWYIPEIEPPKPRRRNISGTKPDTTLTLGEERKTWLRTQGGIQPTIKRLIDEAMDN